MSEIKLTSENFDLEVTASQKPVIVDFWATWCGPCKMLAPIIEELSENEAIKVCKVNVDEEPELSSKFRIMSIPTLMLFKDGEPVKTEIGYMSKEDIERSFGI